MIWTNNNATSPGDGIAGVYLVRRGTVVRILSRPGGMPDVSPDGCRIGVSLSENKQPPELKIVDVCKARD